jgi:predicted anti-sigma-YlaC factor YlaD
MVSEPELSCQEVVELVTNYLENALSPMDRARFEAHLAGCSGCQIYLDQMRTTLRSVGALSEDTLAPVVREQLVQTFHRWKQRAE